MTDEDRTMEPADSQGSSGEETEGAMADFSSGEGLVAFAGLVLLAVWIVFDFLIDNYAMDNVVAVIAAAAAILPRLDRERVERALPLPVLMKALGWTLVLFGVVEILLDIRFGGYDDVGVVVAALLAYAGYAMAFFGARSIEL